MDKVSMARYDYRGDCGHYVERDFRESSFVARCEECEETRLFKRVFAAPAFKRPMQEHYNHSVAQVIRTDAQFDDALKKQSDRISEYTGAEARFERVDHTDTAALKVTDEGLSSTNDQRIKNGLKPYKV